MALDGFTNVFAGNPLDRASARRVEADFLSGQMAAASTLVIPLWNGQPFVEQDPKADLRLAYIDGRLGSQLSGGEERLLFLGFWQDTAVVALDLEGDADPSAGPLENLGRFEDLRASALRLPASEAAMVATAKGMFEWRRRHRFCAACGQPSHVAEAGWKRVCSSCKAEHFPRTDPVVIMLAVQRPKGGEARCLVGRQKMWPRGMWSALAGFLEPGETIEEACARELMEEAGLKASSVRYVFSQPWPYPSSLMIGLIAEVEDGDATPDQTELEAVRWFTKDEAAALIAGKVNGAFAPPRMAIAHHLIRVFSEEG